jgi:hypothetical protein
MKPVLESDIQREICDYLDKKGLFFWRSNNVPALGRNGVNFRRLPKYTPKGLPDIMAVRGGIFYAIEVKRPKVAKKQGGFRAATKLTSEQYEFGEGLIINGGKYVVVRSLDDLKKELPLLCS